MGARPLLAGLLSAALPGAWAVRVEGIALSSRIFMPYTNDPKDMAFAMDAANMIAYDHTQKYLYVKSSRGFVNVVDYMDPKNPKVRYELAPGSEISTIGSRVSSISVCPGEWVFVTVGPNTGDKGSLIKMRAANREERRPLTVDSSVGVGYYPDAAVPNKGCTKVAVANEGNPKTDNIYGMKTEDFFRRGSLSIVDVNKGLAMTSREYKLSDLGGDEDLIAHGVHIGLQENQMTYLDNWYKARGQPEPFAEMRAIYKARYSLEPEYVAWSDDGEQVYLNLQENNAMVKVNVEDGKMSVHSYGLKDWSASGGTDGIDLDDRDNDCDLKHYHDFKTLRQPNQIRTFTRGDIEYMIIAEEAAPKRVYSYPPDGESSDVESIYRERKAFKSIYDDGDFIDKFSGFTGGDGLEAAASNFKKSKYKNVYLSIGSSAVDYSDPAKPFFKGAVGMGGRGVAIYRTKDMKLVWDSGSMFEKESCERYKWSYNSESDGADAELESVAYKAKDAADKRRIEKENKLDQGGCEDRGDGKPGACPMGRKVRREARTSKDGPSVEAVAVGKACGRRYAVTVTDQQSVMFVLDVSNPERGVSLALVTHLSPASKDKSAPVAYRDRSLGDIGVESIVFVEAEESPSGHAGVFIGGQHSGTATFMEFVDGDGNKCGTGDYDEDDDPTVYTAQLIGGTVGGFFGGLLIAAAFTYFIVVPRAKEKGQILRLKSIEMKTTADRAL